MMFCNQVCEWNTYAEGCTKPLDAVCPLSNMNVDRDTNVLTNADHIRSMTDEELAKWLSVPVLLGACLNPSSSTCAGGCQFYYFCQCETEADVAEFLGMPYKEEV